MIISTTITTIVTTCLFKGYLAHRGCSPFGNILWRCQLGNLLVDPLLLYRARAEAQILVASWHGIHGSPGLCTRLRSRTLFHSTRSGNKHAIIIGPPMLETTSRSSTRRATAPEDMQQRMEIVNMQGQDKRNPALKWPRPRPPARTWAFTWASRALVWYSMGSFMNPLTLQEPLLRPLPPPRHQGSPWPSPLLL